ncbi:MAG: DUF692 domain-containing protein [Rhodospirillaceae bacterium]|nr:DUF692 domain-containing protein [Rhodospirillaceae bacterium]
MPATSATIPRRAGLGLRQPHMADFLAGPQPVAWLEVHSENHLADGGPRNATLAALRRDYPVSCHGVGLSLGSVGGLDRTHLARLRALHDWLEPGLVSEHIAWSVAEDGAYLNDLLPLPYTEEALGVLCRNIDQAQTAFARQILVENPSSYVTFAQSTLAEWQFIAEVMARTGCGLLLDVNNIHVSAHNTGFDADAYLDAVPLGAVGEIHVAGHTLHRFTGGDLLIDSHDRPVSDAVWRLLATALARTGPVPVLVERDSEVPPLADLLAEVAAAQALLDRAAETKALTDAA